MCVRRSTIVMVLLAICAHAAAGAPPQWPATAPAKVRDAAAPDALRSLPEAATVAELLAAPAIELDKPFTVRLAVSPRQRELPDVRWLYCLVNAPGAPRRTVVDWPGDPFGPLFINVTWPYDGDELKRLRDLCEVTYALLPDGFQKLYVAPIRLDRDERVQLFGPDGKELVCLDVVPRKDAASWPWFAGLRTPSTEKLLKEADVEAPPQLDVRDVRQRARLQRAFLLPQDRSIDTRPPASDAPLALSATLALKEEGGAVVLHATDAAGRRLMYDVEPEQVLIRWWVDGKPVAAADPGFQQLQEAIRAMEVLRHQDVSTVDTRLRFQPVVPVELTNVHRGDVIHMQMLVWPGKWTSVRLGNGATSECDAAELMRLEESAAPLFGISNRLELKVTDEMVIE